MNLLPISAAILRIFSLDAEPDPAVDLQPRQPFLTDNSSNGFVWLAKRWAEPPDPEVPQVREMLTGLEPWDQQTLDELRAQNLESADDLKQALEFSDWQLQSALPKLATSMHYVSAFNRRYQCGLGGAAAFFHAGRTEAAYLLWERLLSAAERSLKGSTSLLDGAISAGLLIGALDGVLDASNLPENLVGESLLFKLQNRLLQISILPQNVSEICRHEAAWCREYYLTARWEKPTPLMRKIFPDRSEYRLFAQFLYQPIQTLNLSLSLLRRVEPLFMKPLALQASSPGFLYDQGLERAEGSGWWNPNRTGLGMMREAAISPALLDNSCRMTLFLIRAAAVQVALRRWEIRNPGEDLPERLEDLVPTFLDTVPLDPFDGAPLRWNQQQGVVFSIGSDWQETLPDFRDDAEGPSQRKGRIANNPVSLGVRLRVPFRP